MSKEDDCPAWAVELKVKVGKLETDVDWIKSWLKRDLALQGLVAASVAILGILLKAAGVI